jgi:hypothetical protein
MRIRTLVSSSLTVLVVCSLELTTLAGGRDPITRPFRVKGDLALIVSQDPTTFGEAVGFGKGVGSHEGRFVVHTAGSYDFETGDFIGEGILTTANGDLIYFKMRNLGWVEFTGGTGRFENVTGGHTIEPTAPPEQKEVDGQLIVIFRYTGQGTITYSNRSSHERNRPKLEKRRF